MMTFALGHIQHLDKVRFLDCFSLTLTKIITPSSPSGTGGVASSAVSLSLGDDPASPAASLLASEAAALGANVIVIANTSTK
jgi:hypothetical protein